MTTPQFSRGSPYQPHRESYFALKYIRLMAKSGAAERMGGMAFALCCIVAAYQDLKRFKAPATFFNNVIMGMLGFSKLDTLIRARNLAIEEGWLGYESAGGSRMPGRYWVCIPDGIEEMSDVAGDDGGESPEERAYRDGYNAGFKDGQGGSVVGTVPEKREPTHPKKQEPSNSTVTEKRESNGSRKGSRSGVEGGDFLPIPIPIPIPSCSETASLFSEQQEEASPSFLEFPTKGKGKKSWHLTAAKVAEYVEAFPGVDVPFECRRALQWCRDNPQNQKTPGGMPAFLNRWLTKEQNNSRRGSNNGERRFTNPGEIHTSGHFESLHSASGT